MSMMMGARNSRGFSDYVSNFQLPPPSHITYEGVFNQLEFNVGPKTQNLIDVHLGYARYQFQKSQYDDKINEYLAIFLKSRKDGSQRDGTILNATICLDISGSMGCWLSASTVPSNMNRLQLSLEAIKMFFSKLQPNDSFGFVVFNNEGHLILNQTKKSQINEEEFFQLLTKIKQGGGTTISEGFKLASNVLAEYVMKMPELVKNQCQNRIIMLTDVADNSIKGTNQFVEEASNSNIHLTIIGISSQFKSETCQKLKHIKGFNYFSAVNEDDLMRYVFHTFNFTFFSIVHDTTIKLQAENIKSIQVYGSTDPSEFANEQKNSFMVTKVSTIFPSQISIKDGTVYTFGGLILLKIERNEPSAEFKAKLHIEYRTPSAKIEKKIEDIDFKAPLNEQYLSEECLREALEGYFFTSELKNILKKGEGKKEKKELEEYLPSLEELLKICPENKKKQVELIIKMIKQ